MSPYTWFFIAFVLAGVAIPLTPVASLVVILLGIILILVTQEER